MKPEKAREQKRSARERIAKYRKEVPKAPPEVLAELQTDSEAFKIHHQQMLESRARRVNRVVYF